MRFRSFTVAAFGVALLAGITACTPDPAPPTTTVASTVDQSFYQVVDQTTLLRTNDIFGQTRAHAQVFTAGRSGVLDKVSAIIGANGANPIVPVTVTVQTLDGTGRPSGTVLGQGVWNGPALPDAATFADIPLGDTADVVSGVQYALVFQNLAPSPGMVLYLTDPNYPGGQSYEYFTVGASGGWSADPFDDVPFKTWVR